MLLLVLGLFAQYIAGQTTTTGTTSSSTSAPEAVEGLRACSGIGAICEVKIDLHDHCEEQREAQGDDGYFECICASGYAAVDEA
jgi:hypothetical protein